MLTYRVSIDASVFFSVVAENEQDAVEAAQRVIMDELPECLEFGGPRQVNAYPGNNFENLEVETSWPVRPDEKALI